MTDLQECLVCLEDYDPAVLIQCFACDTKTCRGCTQRYLLESLKDAHCSNPSCNVSWDVKFLLSVFPKSWINGTKPGQYRHARKKVLLDRQKALIPETMAIVAERQYRDKVAFVHRCLADVDDKATTMRNYAQRDQDRYLGYLERTDPVAYREQSTTAWRHEDMTRRIEKIRRREHAARDKILRVMCPGLNLTPQDIGGGQSSAVVKVKRTFYEFICPCPVPECRGLISKMDAKCAICSALICRACHVLVLDKNTHQCDPDVVATIELLKNDTKPCPKCAVPIYRMAGCDQMWCTQCNIAFSWRTGELETGIVHNPHAARWYQANPDANPHGDQAPGHRQPCEAFEVMRHDHKQAERHKECQRHFKVSHSMVENAFLNLDAIIYRIGRRNDPAMVEEEALREIRIRYILGKTTEDGFQQAVFKTTRKHAKARTILTVCTTTRAIAMDLFHAVRHRQIGIDVFYAQLHRLMEFHNETMILEMQEFGGKYPLFEYYERDVHEIIRGVETIEKILAFHLRT